MQRTACLCALAAGSEASRASAPATPPAHDPKHHAHHKMKPGDTKGMKFWERATFDPWAVAHSGSVPPEYLGVSKAEEHWIAPEDWFDRRNLTARILQIFPLIDMNSNGFVELSELERWHHVNKVFVEKARAAESLEYHDTDHDGKVSLEEWLADTHHGTESLEEHEDLREGWDHEADEEVFDEDEWLREPDDHHPDDEHHDDEHHDDEHHDEHHDDDELHHDDDGHHEHDDEHHEHDDEHHEDEHEHDHDHDHDHDDHAAGHVDDVHELTDEHGTLRRLMMADDGGGGVRVGRGLMSMQDEQHERLRRAVHEHPASMSDEEAAEWTAKIEKLKKKYKTPEDHEYDDAYWDEAGEHAGAAQDAGLQAPHIKGSIETMADRLREGLRHAMEHEHGSKKEHTREDDEKWLEDHHVEDEYEDDEADYEAGDSAHHLHDMFSPVKTHGLANLEGEERLYHFEELFRAADVTHDGKLDVVELRHLLNPHLSKNARLQMAALNMTIANELPFPARSKEDIQAGLVPKDQWMSELHWLVTEWLPGNPQHGTPGEDKILKDRAAKEFARLDANKDDHLSLKELAPVFPILFPDDTRYSHVSAVDQMKHADTNKDGKLSVEEMIVAVKVFYGAVHPDPHHLNPMNSGTDHMYEHDEFR